MKRKFRRALASLLAVLMVICAMPFTAFAGYFNYVYDGYAELGEMSYENGDDLQFGDNITIDTTLGSVEDGTINSMIFDNFTPELHIITCDITDPANRTKYYGASKTVKYDTADAAGLIVNPAQLKAGQIISVTFEGGGMDCLASMEIKGEYNKDLIKPVRYYRNAWTDVTANTQAVKKTASYYQDARNGENILNDDGSIVEPTDAVRSAYRICVVSNVTDSKYIVHDESITGKYGIIIGAMTMQVLQDCDLKDALGLKGEDGTTSLVPYDQANMDICFPGQEQKYAPYLNNLPVIWDKYEATQTTTQYTVKFVDAAGTTVSETKYDEGTKAADVTVPANTAMAQGDATGHKTYAWPAVADVTADVTYTEVESTAAHTLTDTTIKKANCTEAGEVQSTCSVCGWSTTTYPAALGHNWSEYVSNNDATCLANGTETRTCSVCNVTESREIADSQLAHSYTGAATSNNNGTHEVACVNSCTTTQTADCTFGDVIVDTPATLQAPGAGHKVCSACGYSVNVEIPQLTCDHQGYETRTENAKAATCTEAGYTGDVYCTNCDALITKGTATDPLGHEWSEYVSNNDATCLADGTKTRTCSVCNETETVADEGSMLAHDYSKLVAAKVDATCTEAGTEAVYECVNGCNQTTGGEPIEAIGHAWVESGRTPATVKDAEVISYVCQNDASHTKTETGAPAIGVNITLDAETAVPVTINGEAVAAGATVNVPYGSDVVLAADTDKEFVGWMANGTKIVSTDATATVKALADVTYEPIVKTAAADTCTVVFYDMFQNVIAVQTVAKGSAVTAPTAPSFTGYTFKGWDTDLTAITEDTVVNAIYEANTDLAYTVTADGCTITVDGAEVDGTNLAYNTLVTVTKAGATAWKINDATVAFGESYTFYVGSDVTVVPVTDAVDTTPVVAAVSTTKTDTCNVVFLATRSIDGGQYVNAGFVYGKNLADDDLVLDKVGKTGSNADSGKVKAYYCATDALQFSLSYGITAQAGTASARAFLAYIDANGDTQVVYGAVQSYNYDTGIAK